MTLRLHNAILIFVHSSSSPSVFFVSFRQNTNLSNVIAIEVLFHVTAFRRALSHTMNGRDKREQRQPIVAAAVASATHQLPRAVHKNATASV